MKIRVEKYSQALFEILQTVEDQQTAEKLVKNFINLLVKNNDFYQVDKILKIFKNKWNQKFGLIKAEIKSAHPLNLDLEKMILEYIKKEATVSQVESENKIDKTILGGVIIKYNDKIFDASLKTKISRLEESLLN